MFYVWYICIIILKTAELRTEMIWSSAWAWKCVRPAVYTMPFGCMRIIGYLLAKWTSTLSNPIARKLNCQPKRNRQPVLTRIQPYVNPSVGLSTYLKIEQLISIIPHTDTGIISRGICVHNITLRCRRGAKRNSST